MLSSLQYHTASSTVLCCPVCSTVPLAQQCCVVLSTVPYR